MFTRLPVPSTTYYNAKTATLQYWQGDGETTCISMMAGGRRCVTVRIVQTRITGIS